MTYFPELADPAIRLAPMDEAVKRFMSKYLTTALLRNGAHMQRTAVEVGVHRNTLSRLCKQAGVATDSKSRRELRKLARRVA